jgi:CRISPR-associated protein Csb1
MPSISEQGGVTISHAVQTTVLSLAGLRRLHFQLGKSNPNPDVDSVAHTLLAALALAGVAYQRQDGYDLRSRCLLVPASPAVFELLPSDSSAAQSFTLDPGSARKMFEQSTEEAIKHRLPWLPKELSLRPRKQLLGMIRRSRELRFLQNEP